MSTTTPTRGLVKPAGADDVDITQLNANMDTLDKAPLGLLGKAEVTANQTGIIGIIDLTGLSVTVTVAANRKIRVKGYVDATMNLVSGQTEVLIYEGATPLHRALGNVNATGGITLAPEVNLQAPAAGAHTYKLRATANGANNMETLAAAAYPAWIAVYDDGGI